MRFTLWASVLLLTCPTSADQICSPGDSTCRSSNAVQVTAADDNVKMVKGLVQSFVYVESDRKKGTRFRRAVMVSEVEDLETKVNDFCTTQGIDTQQCTYLAATIERKRGALKDAPVKPFPPTVHIVVQYYNDGNPLRAREIDACLRFNLENPHVVQVHALLEPGARVPLDVASHSKLHIVPDHPRLTFKAAFEYASNTLPKNTTVALINGDIYLDHDSAWHSFTGRLEDLTSYGKGNYSLALARAEVDEKGAVWKMKYMQEELAYSFAQDAWVFKTPLVLDDSDFTVGNCPGSDNAIAERLNRAGRVPLNFCHIWRIYHLDSARKKFQEPGMIYTNKTDRSHPEKRGFRTLPSFGEVRSFADLDAHNWRIDPVLEYMFMTEYLSQSTDLGHPR